MQKTINVLGLLIIALAFSLPAYVGAQTPPPATQAPTTTASTSKIEQMGNYRFIAPVANYFQPVVDLTTNDALAKYLNTWFRLLVGIGGIFAVIRLILTGFTIITSSGSVDAQKKIRDELITIVSSLALVAGSWIFLNTLNPQLVKSNLALDTITVAPRKVAEPPLPIKPGWYFKVRDDDSGIADYIGPHMYKGESGAISLTSNLLPGSIPSIIARQVNCTIDLEYRQNIHTYGVAGTGLLKGDAPEGECFEIVNQAPAAQGEIETRSTFTASKIYVNRAACTGNETTKKGYCGCTNVGGLTGDAIATIIQLKNNFLANKGSPDNCTADAAANKDVNLCPIVITGGTETACHTTHKATNSDIFDLRWHDALNSFLIKMSTYTAPSFTLNGHVLIRYYYNGFWYTDEGGKDTGFERHFHVCRDVPDQGNRSTTCSHDDVNGNVLECITNPGNTNQKVCRSKTFKRCVLDGCGQAPFDWSKATDIPTAL